MMDRNAIAATIATLAAVLAASGDADAARSAVERGITSVQPPRVSLTTTSQMPHNWPRVPLRGTVK